MFGYLLQIWVNIVKKKREEQDSGNSLAFPPLNTGIDARNSHLLGILYSFAKLNPSIKISSEH